MSGFACQEAETETEAAERRRRRDQFLEDMLVMGFEPAEVQQGMGHHHVEPPPPVGVCTPMCYAMCGVLSWLRGGRCCQPPESKLK